MSWNPCKNLPGILLACADSLKEAANQEEPEIHYPNKKKRKKAARELIETAKRYGVTISSCESYTAGLFCSTLGSVPGAPAVLAGGLVTYMTRIKSEMAQVDPALIETYGVVSEPCARAMAENTRRLFSTDYCVSFTGNAGPSAMEDKPAGEVYWALSGNDGTLVWENHFALSRRKIQKLSVYLAMVELRNRILEDHGDLQDSIEKD